MHSMYSPPTLQTICDSIGVTSGWSHQSRRALTDDPPEHSL
jgi:hypothetical protein